MNKMKILTLLAVAVFAAAACQPAANTTNGSNTHANSNSNSKPTAAAPTKDALVALEKSAYEAWKTKDSKFWEPFLSDKFVGYGTTGKLDKAAAIKEYSGTDCDVKSVAFSDEQMMPLGNDAALITYKVAVDGTCGGQKIPAQSWAAGLYVREGEKWKGAFHAESAIPDPNAKPGQAAASTAKPATTTTATEPKPDAATDALIALEKKAWDDWKDKNAKGLDEWAGKDLVAFTSKGRSDRATALKTWAEDGCEVKSVSLTDPASTSLSPDFSLLTFKAAVDGKCQGSAIPTENGISIYGKEGGAWKALFTMGTPIM